MIVRRNGESVELMTDHIKPEHLQLFRSLLDRSFNPLATVRVVEINGAPATESELAGPFVEFGFRREYKSMNLWKY